MSTAQVPGSEREHVLLVQGDDLHRPGDHDLLLAEHPKVFRNTGNSLLNKSKYTVFGVLHCHQCDQMLKYKVAQFILKIAQ